VEAKVIELAQRRSVGYDVRLLWKRATGQLAISVTSEENGEELELPVAAVHALDAFWHPFLYLSAGEALPTPF
jgi:hypothetical protein